MISLKIVDEVIMAEAITSNTAIIKSLSLYPEYSYDDMVLYNSDQEVTQLIKKVSITKYIQHNNILSLSKSFKEIKEYFSPHCLYIQHCESGVIAIAFLESTFSESRFQNLLKKCPISCFALTVDESDEPDEEEKDFS